MSELVHWYLGLILYMMAYLTIGLGTMFCWKIWAAAKGGLFWDDSIKKGLRMYYPRIDYFIEHHNLAWTIFRIGFWPVANLIRMIVMTNILNRINGSHRY